MKLDNQQEIQSYIAGLFDAEGWFTYHLQKKKYWNPQIGFVNTDLKIIDIYRKFLDQNKIKYHVVVRKRKRWHKIQTSIIIEGDLQVLKWLKLVGTKLVIKKKQLMVIKESLNIKPKFRNKYRIRFQELLISEDVGCELIDKNWLMGFWEGNGSASIIKRNYRGLRIKYIPLIRFFSTSEIAKNSIAYFFKKEKIPHYIQRFKRDKNKPKYVISISGLKRCLRFSDKVRKLDLTGKISIVRNFCQRRISLPPKTPYSDLDLLDYERLKILNDYTSNY